MKVKAIIGALLFISLAAGSYWLFDYYTGNHIIVKEVFQSSKLISTESQAMRKPESQLDKKWYILDESKVYFQITTSEESVFSQIQKIDGFWNFNLKHPEKMSAEAHLDLTTEDSGNSGRDNHIKSLLSGNASFTLQSFDQWGNPDIVGQPMAYKMTGLLKLIGTEKVVQFTGEVLYEDELLKLKGETTVTFADFGLTNPHLVTLTTQDDIKIILQLVLSDEEPLKEPDASPEAS